MTDIVTPESFQLSNVVEIVKVGLYKMSQKLSSDAIQHQTPYRFQKFIPLQC